MKIACGIEYDGTGYRGFQRLAEHQGRTIQGELEAAIARISGAHSVVYAAGRTDAGVHASGQVIHFRTLAQLTPEVWRRALNAVLSDAVSVLWCRVVSDDFHARHSAISRSYRYSIWNDVAPSPLQARYSYHRSQALDVEAMQAACQMLPGHKDFGAFGHSPNDTNPMTPGQHHCVRHLLEARCTRGTQGLIYCDFTANAFLTGMVRRMTGTLLLVGQKRLRLDEFAAIVEKAEKTHPGSAAPPHGLCLVRVEYPENIWSNER